MNVNVDVVVGTYAELVNQFGVDSEEVKNYEVLHKGVPKFVQLAPIIKELRKRIDAHVQRRSVPPQP